MSNTDTIPPKPASDTLVHGEASWASYGARMEDEGGDVRPPRDGEDAQFWAVYEWVEDETRGPRWAWRADCNTEDTARTLAEALTAGARQSPARKMHDA